MGKRGAPGTSNYSKSHRSKSVGGREHVDVYRTDTEGRRGKKEHSTDPRDIRAGNFLSRAFNLFRGNRDD